MIEAYLTDTATQHHRPGRDILGDPSGVSIDLPVRCRVDFKTRIIRDFKGVEVMAQASLILKDRPDPADAFTVSIGGTATRYAIVAIHRAQDFAPRFWRVWLV